MKHKRSISVDFDGVIHSYKQPWIAAHVIPDPPVEGAIDFLYEMVQRYQVWIFSTRSKTWRGRRAIRAWLRKHAGGRWYEAHAPGLTYGLEDVRVTFKKPPCLIYIDDRGYRFTGANFPTRNDIERAKPWNKGGPR